MTTFQRVMATCAVCGQVSEHEGLTSTNAFGSMDLDSRPPEMERSTIDMRIMRCPGCGYCVQDIGNEITFSLIGKEIALRVLASERYHEMQSNKKYVQLARDYACSALIWEECGRTDRAISAWMNAAWAMDDEKKAGPAAPLRREAVKGLLKSLSTKASAPADERASVQIVIIDLQRRAGDMEEALETLSRATKDAGKLLEQLFAYEEHLISSGDRKCHRVDEAVKWAEDN